MDIRLDVFLSSRLAGLSRSRIQSLIKSENVKVNNLPSKPSYRLRKRDRISYSIPAPASQVPDPEAVEFDIIHEDHSLLVLNKPPGLVVHPAPGHNTGTLVHGLLKRCGDLSEIGGVERPGIVHRLDKDTSGLLVVAKTDRAHSFLAEQFKSGRVKKQYAALVHGQISPDEGRIDFHIARHPTRRKQMSVTLNGGRRALTLWRVIEKFKSGFSLLSISIKTGRTHQIRVHLSHIGHPVVGDTVYGHGRKFWKRHVLCKKGVLPSVNRQMLHAKLLGFVHPDQERYLEFEAPLPDDMKYMVNALKWLDLQDQANKGLDIKKKDTTVNIPLLFSCLLEDSV